MFQGRTLFAALLSGLIGLGVHAKTASSEFPAVPGEYIVKLKNPSLLQTPSALMAFNSSNVRVVSKKAGVIVVQRPVSELRAQSVAALEQNPMVEYAEPNFIYTIVGGTSTLPNDPKLGDLWGLINTGQKSSGDAGVISGLPGFDISAQRAWELETGSSDVKIAVIDTGVDYDIEDLNPNMWTNLVELNGTPGVDDDGNGCVDDIHGCDFVNNDGDPKDDHGHGSHVSGTIAAKGNNGTQIVGVAWNATIIGVKFLSASGSGTLENAIKSIDYATANQVQIMSNSWGGGGRSQALFESIQRARDAGILFVAAAGNSGVNMDNSPQYPAGYEVENIVSVAAVDNAGRLASFSNYGRSVDIAAPGVNVLSVTPNGLKSWSGTSMACPHVSGVAALLYSQDMTQDFTRIKERLRSGARPIEGLRGKVATGMLDAYYSLSGEAPPADPNDPSRWETMAFEGLESDHPYADNFSGEWEVEVPGATKMAIHFSEFNTEANYDYLAFYDRNGKLLGKMSGNVGADAYSPTLMTDYVRIEFKTDRSVNRYGFKSDSIAYQ